MTSKSFEELYSELNSMNTQDIKYTLEQALKNLEKCTAPFEVRDIVEHQQEIINRQQVEIERLKNRNDFLEFEYKNQSDLFWKRVELAKYEAVKEFAEKSEMEVFIKQDEQRNQMLDILKSHRATLSYSDVEQATDNWLRGYGEAVQDVIGVFDNLLKEMAGDTE